MNLKKGRPPIYDKIIQAGLKPQSNTVFAYGNDLYIQDIEERLIDEVLLAHEEVHTKQQGNDIEGWWDRYLSDSQFRYEQELEAYATQYHKITTISSNNKLKKWALNTFATDLASPMYGNIVSIHEAESKIRNKSKEYGNN